MKTMRVTSQRFTTLFTIIMVVFYSAASAAQPFERAEPSPTSSTSVHHREHQWVSPVSEPLEVLRAFQKPQQRWAKGHRGVDIVAHGSIRAPMSGKIIFSGKVVDRYVITIEHEDGYKSSFEPVTQAKETGETVSIGEVIAQVDETVQHCPQRCIHWGVRQNIAGEWEYINPLTLLFLEKPSILLPVAEDFLASHAPRANVEAPSIS
ncbi:M23 family metallopeptidase [Rothia sp. P13129]|uniref:M23 family metallopeptidase n=1 Tax=unclassified Rothia (in: high G+C Gram-positive bacteria) TaxID=2689056 RepID=UPI003ACEA519